MCIATHPVWALPRSLATTGGIISLFSLPAGTKMFQFPAFASLLNVVIAALQAAGLSHSEIRGSTDICSYPRLIAAYHVLLRLREPRHPPDALAFFRRSPQHIIHRGSLILSAVTLRFYSQFLKTKSFTYSLVCQYVKDLYPAKGLVENIGVEPMTSCMPCKRSSQLS